MGGYLYFSQSFAAQLPIAGSIPRVPADSLDQGRTCGVSAQAPGDKSSPLANGSQEIADVTGQGDTLFSLLNDNVSDENSVRKVADSLAAVIQASKGQAFDCDTDLNPGSRYSVTVDRDGKFLKATLELDPANVFHASVQDDVLRSWKEDVVLDFKTEAVCFKVVGTLTESVLRAGEGTELALKLSNVFRYDIDFQSESCRGDTCTVLFERRYADDRPSGYGQILCAAYEGKKTGKKSAVLFNTEYYDEKGVELKKNFLRSPLSVIRVTSRFGQRFHPVLRVWRKHNGVDYGAATGTPVWSVAGGVVTFSGWQNGYGNYVCIKHDSGYESRYGHLHRTFVKKGQRVKQRQRIGLVGMTGIATGPHLDFQLVAGKKHVNPLGVKMVNTLRSVPDPLKERFYSVAQERFTAMGASLPTRTARAATATEAN